MPTLCWVWQEGTSLSHEAHTSPVSSLLPRIAYLLYSAGFKMLPPVSDEREREEGRQEGRKRRKTRSLCRVWAGPAVSWKEVGIENQR